MGPKFSKGDRVTLINADVEARLEAASREGTVLQGDPDHGDEGTYQIMFDGEDLPQWIMGRSLRPSGGH